MQADVKGCTGSFRFNGKTHAVSDTISPWTPVKPSLPAATAAAAMVLTLLGASGHNSATEPLYKTRLPSPSVQSERMSPVSRKQDGCLDILINKAWKESMIQHMTMFIPMVTFRHYYVNSLSQKFIFAQASSPLCPSLFLYNSTQDYSSVTFKAPLSFSLWMSWPPHNAPLGTYSVLLYWWAAWRSFWFRSGSDRAEGEPTWEKHAAMIQWSTITTK